MCSLSYLTFDEYQKLNGKCTEDAFPLLQFEVESKMDYITSGNLSRFVKNMTEIPKSIKMTEAKLLDIQFEVNNLSNSGVGITSYSNGIETFGYDTSKDLEKSVSERFCTIMMEYLYPEYPELFYRGRWVRVERKNNASE